MRRSWCCPSWLNAPWMVTVARVEVGDAEIRGELLHDRHARQNREGVRQGDGRLAGVVTVTLRAPAAAPLVTLNVSAMVH